VAFVTKHFGGPPAGTAFGCCYLCRTAPKGLYLRTNQSIQFEGHLVLCLSCTKQLGRAAGLVDPKASEDLKKKVAALETEVRNLRAKSDAFDIFARTLEEHANVVLPQTPETA